MSRVTIGNLLHDYEDDKIDIITGVQAYDIEVVPRKMVEMIIAECNSQISDFKGNPSIVNTATYIKNYAESLLKQFEEETE